MIRFLAIAVVVWIGVHEPIHADEKTPIFESDIKPILMRKCGKCHRGKVQKGGLDLSSIRSIRRGGESGDPAISKTVADSLLWTMIDGGNMPPEGEPSLTKEQREIIRRWIATGAHSKSPSNVEAKQVTQHDVLPIVLLRCTTCHGARLQRGGLDLRTPQSMRKGGDHGPALVPGKPSASRMIQRIESEACPPREMLLKYFIRRPPDSEVAVLRKWIVARTPEVGIQPDIASTESDPLVTDEDRKHWAFQPVRSTINARSIDEFIANRLQDSRLTFSPEADRDTLIRRAYLNLVGMPPSLTEWKRWRESTSSHWYADMVDHLLGSPHYGERWGRYWLDLAGYADSEGGVSSDPVRKVAWKYRDYVIRSFNNDKPYDRFLLEQIAGDELVDYERAPVITDEVVENLVATGFLRMGIDQTGSRTMNFVPERLGVISDAIRVLGSSVMGLTLECAQCHSHKYDPIPHRDYYRFKAILKGALDEHDWLTFKNRLLEVDVPERRERVAKVNPPLRSKLKKLESKRRTSITELRRTLLREHYPSQSEQDRSDTLRAIRIADNNRSQRQRILVEQLQAADVVPDAKQTPAVMKARRVVEELEHQIAEIQRQLEPSLAIRALWDRGEPSPTYILKRGEHTKPGRLVGPGVPSVLTDGRTPFVIKPPFPDGTRKTGRRLALVRWLTQPDHPLTARVFVNRVWYHHFGTGIVKSLENFGVKGERPTHPQLLDWLASQFVERGWSIKELHRLIMNSRTYRQTSRITDEIQELDPQNRLLSHMPMRRMDAEALRDSMLFVSGALDDTAGGRPDRVIVSRSGLVTANATAEHRWRRSIYLQYRRTELPSMLATFDYPEMGPNCISRSISTVSLQPLMLMNNQRVRELAELFANRVEKLSKDGGSIRNHVELVYQLALSRHPKDNERQWGVETLKELKAAWNGDGHAALVTYCHTILNSAAFLYID